VAVAAVGKRAPAVPVAPVVLCKGHMRSVGAIRWRLSSAAVVVLV